MVFDLGRTLIPYFGVFSQKILANVCHPKIPIYLYKKKKNVIQRPIFSSEPWILDVFHPEPGTIQKYARIWEKHIILDKRPNSYLTSKWPIFLYGFATYRPIFLYGFATYRPLLFCKTHHQKTPSLAHVRHSQTWVYHTIK